MHHLQIHQVILQNIDPNNTVNIGGARYLFGCNKSACMPFTSVAWMKTVTVILGKARRKSRHREPDNDRNRMWDKDLIVRS